MSKNGQILDIVWRGADKILGGRLLSTFTVVAFDIKDIDLRELEPAGSIASGISSTYCDCMLKAFGEVRRYTPVTPEPDPASNVIYLAGPWGRLGWAGQSVLAIAAGYKWGVFLSNLNARIDAIRSAYCVAKTLNCARALVFDSDGMALELASDGRPIDEVIAALQSKPFLMRFCMTSAADAAVVANKMGQFEDAEEGYFKIDFLLAVPVGEWRGSGRRDSEAGHDE
ncbi:hypothetical protein [Tahibacter soli]|uniref:Uncharacterized protein n=1 Tax=Tahibacter soli TaxID=2983605 RepID=A0A9X3YNK5_9GAMM|nr:hypothetical protein [Tahibacter soli]MDC8013996.1 hypothetical protein [Tahibacter soli]